ncbi:MAG: helix-turn-helix transcriptional regulator [Ktedonobacteraceae bacterium]|nr:helix-turn-helix transcriptional regulator [Ktedonobacteraceae bacterium]MBO0791567.1 helix-turn-helix transcriptional regulator [Ktedonobacteraceae bacterium]
MIRLKVKEIAEQKRISMTRLSRIADINYKTIRALFSDPYRDVAYSTLLKLSRALGVPVEALVEEVPDEENEEDGVW